MDLFEHRQQQLSETDAPLAARMRPRSLDEFMGQAAIIGPGRLLRRAIQADQLASLIFYGPPGTGKTTLARIIANTTQAYFIAINAVLAGVKDIRAAVEKAQTLRGQFGQKTILFVDEVHRFSKSQQDALLPWVENGTVTLIGATTENPYFEVNKALVSRSRLFQLKPLQGDDLKEIALQALRDDIRGYGYLKVEVTDDALEHWVNIANGDARSLLNALELAVETTSPNDQGVIAIDLAIAEASIQRRAVLYDKEGDAHFDTISAFIKSLRGSDPDAALYWLARMVYAGEDPRFIFRRMLIAASEDIGLADPNAVSVVVACASAFDRVGMPEGQYPLAQAALYLASTSKSNSVLGYFDALNAVQKEREAEVPNHLKDGNRDQKGFGHGAGYKYPHAYREHWVSQQYLPGTMQGQVFYQPADQGFEAQIRDRIIQQREAQVAAMMEDIPVEGLTYGPTAKGQERWLQRTVSQSGQQLARDRDRLFSMTKLQRHHVVLDLLSDNGLLLWELVRQVPEGGVYGRVTSSSAKQSLQEQAKAISELQRPILFISEFDAIANQLNQQEPEIQCDRIFGRNLLTSQQDRQTTPEAIATLIQQLLQAEGEAILLEMIPKQSQRIYELVSLEGMKPKLTRDWKRIEESFYEKEGGGNLNWDVADLEMAFANLGLEMQGDIVETQSKWLVSPAILKRWFQSGNNSYGDRLQKVLSKRQVDEIERILTTQLLNQTITWRMSQLYCKVRKL